MKALIDFTNFLAKGYEIYAAEGYHLILVNIETGDVETLDLPKL